MNVMNSSYDVNLSSSVPTWTRQSSTDSTSWPPRCSPSSIFLKSACAENPITLTHGRVAARESSCR